jgi:hypothetical protein
MGRISQVIFCVHGVISPLLANIYLHEVLDTWFEREVRPRLNGKAALIRFVDDFVIVFEDRDDAQRVYQVLPKRFGRYGLEIQEAKTRLLNFSYPGRKESKTEVFDFLGFTHFWGKSRKGNRQTANGRRRKAEGIKKGYRVQGVRCKGKAQGKAIGKPRQCES